METEFGIGWSVKKVKLQISQNCKRFSCNQTKKIKKLPAEKRLKKRPVDVSVKVWKELVKVYENWMHGGSPLRRVPEYLNLLIRLYKIS